MSQSDRSRVEGAELEKLQRWRMRLADEFKEILEEVDALKTEPSADHSDARQRREGSQTSLPDGTELREAVEELDSEAREYAAREAAIDRPTWFGPIEQTILQATAYLDTLFYETERILDEASACRHPFNCRCQRQLRFFDERIRPILTEWEQFMAHAEALKKRR
ncbi:MAG: hypothetical protein AUH69_07915 [Actinobacteria bacterium 13_1_40CM_4_65_12]|nr:MAG: hypothetical protein AUH69_07915 [Actinobacteria bacterium 13_1_40CM_4_65_12]